MKTVTLNEKEINNAIDEICAELNYWENLSDKELEENHTSKSYKIGIQNQYLGQLEVLNHLKDLLDD